MLTSGLVIAAAQPSAAATPPDYVPEWAPSTDYALGQQVISPNNDVVSANAVHTSSTAYANDTALWTLSSTFASKVTETTVVSGRLSETSLTAAYAQIPEAISPSPSSAPQPPYGGMLAQCNQAGHGWVDGTGTVSPGSQNPNATDAPVQFGAQSFKITTNGTGGTTRAKKSGLTIDMTGRQPVLWIAVDDPTKILNIQVYIGDSTFTNFFRFDFESPYSGAPTVARYVRGNHLHRLTLGWADVGSIQGTPSRSALTQVQITINDQSTGVLNAWVYGFGYQPETTAFPNGVVSFTFDDGYLAAYSVAAPYLDKYGYQATAFPIVDIVGVGGRLTLANLTSLQNDRGWEIGAHAATNANHTRSGAFTSLSPAQLDAELLVNKRWLVANELQGADIWAYPQGLYNDAVIANAQKYYSAARSQFVFHRETVPPGERMRLRDWSLGSTESLARTKALVDQAVAGKEWLIFTFHDLVASGATGGSQWNIPDFQALVDYVASKDMAVRTVGDVLRRPAGSQGSAAGASPWGFPYTVDPGMIRSDFVTMTANTSLFMRVIQGGTISNIAMVVSASVGNISVGVYRNSGLGRSSVPGALLASSGSVACPANGYAELALSGSVDVLPGDWLAISTSGAASFRSALGSPSTNDLGKGRQMRANGHPLVTLPAGLAATTGYPIVLIGG